MATKVVEAIGESEQELETFAPEREGYLDFSTKNVKSQTKAFVEDRIAVYDRRIMLLHAFKAAAEALLADGHPGIPIAATDAESYADMQDQLRTMSAAFSRTSAAALADLGLTSSPPMPKQMVKFALDRSRMSRAIRCVLDRSDLDDRYDGHEWLESEGVDQARKASLLNVLAVLSLTPPIMMDLVGVVSARADRIHATFRSSVCWTLDALVTDPGMPFYLEPGKPHPIHREALANVPELANASMTSYRGEGDPSLQIVIASSPFDYTVADIDLDLHNPLQDVVGMVGHAREVIRNKRRDQVTDAFAVYETLRRGPAAPFLCYSLDQ